MAAKPRDVFFMTLSNALLIDMPTGPDYTDVLQTMEDIEIHVLERGSPIPPATPVYVEIFQSGNLAETAQGPTSTSGAKIPDTATNNPFRTGPSGNIEFWVEGPREVDVYVHDTVPSPANRISDRTFGWNATAVGAESLPTTMLVKDGGITLASLADEIKRQLTQIGEVIDWWRPSAAVPIPPGFVICDGRAVLAAEHDFPAPHAGAQINVPDLRNAFILGALPSTAGEGAIVKGHGVGSALGNNPGDAPGITGAGGSNAGRDFAHGHGVPGVSHTHYVRVADHTHGSGYYTGNHSHSVGVSVSVSVGATGYGTVSRAAGSGTTETPGHTHGGSGSGGGTAYEVGNIGVYGASAALGAQALYLNSDPPSSGTTPISLNTATNSTTWTNDPGADLRPRFIGLLKLMKVKHS